MKDIQAGVGNTIDESASIRGDVVIGHHNSIGKNVLISGFEGQACGKITIGDCNCIHDNTRILVGAKGLSIGDWNVLHNNMLVIGHDCMNIGHNCWFGQNTILDSTGCLSIGNGVRVGMGSQIWTHAASGELIEGCTLYAMRETVIEDDVWLVGSCIVSSGLRLGRRSICLTGSVVTKDTLPSRVYGGSPAKLLEKLNYWKTVTGEEKLEMMHKWILEFAERDAERLTIDYRREKKQILVRARDGMAMLFRLETCTDQHEQCMTCFDLVNKTYTKTLSSLERRFYRFIYNHKARFIPVSHG